MTYGQKPTMEDTYNFLNSMCFSFGRSNGKYIMLYHLTNIVYAVSRQIAEEAIIRKNYIDGSPFFKKSITECKCPTCKNHVRHGQRYCDNCGQALQYDY